MSGPPETMPGPLSRIRRRRDDAPAPAAAPAPTDQPTEAMPAVEGQPAPDAQPAPQPQAVQPAPATTATTVAPAPPTAVHAPAAPGAPEATAPAAPEGAAAPTEAVPTAPGELPPLSPGFRDRGRLRRRLRYLREVRELGYRDLGGLVFDLHRFGRPGEELVRGKLDALGAVDRELRALARALDDRHEYTDLRQAGVAACPRCAALHGSDARFCPQCGLALDGSLVGAGGVEPAEVPVNRTAPPVQVPLWGTGAPGAPGGAPVDERPHAAPQPLFGGDAPTQAHAPARTEAHEAQPAPQGSSAPPPRPT